MTDLRMEDQVTVMCCAFCPGGCRSQTPIGIPSDSALVTRQAPLCRVTRSWSETRKAASTPTTIDSAALGFTAQGRSVTRRSNSPGEEHLRCRP